MRAQMKNATLLRNTIAYCMFRILSAIILCGTLLPAADLGGNRLTFKYDYMGRRVEMCVEELDVVIATNNAAGTSWFLHDANKNVIQKTEADGDLLDKYAYASFGGNAGEAKANIGFSSEVFDCKSLWSVVLVLVFQFRSITFKSL